MCLVWGCVSNVRKNLWTCKTTFILCQIASFYQGYGSSHGLGCWQRAGQWYVCWGILKVLKLHSASPTEHKWIKSMNLICRFDCDVFLASDHLSNKSKSRYSFLYRCCKSSAEEEGVQMVPFAAIRHQISAVREAQEHPQICISPQPWLGKKCYFIKVLVSSVPHCISLHSWASACGCCFSTLVCFPSPVMALRSSLSRLESRRCPTGTPSLIHALMLHGRCRVPNLLARLADSVGKGLAKAAGVQATKAVTALVGLKYLVLRYARPRILERPSRYVCMGTLSGVHLNLTLSLQPCTKSQNHNLNVMKNKNNYSFTVQGPKYSSRYAQPKPPMRISGQQDCEQEERLPTCNYWFFAVGAEACVCAATCYMQILLTSTGSNQSWGHSANISLPEIAAKRHKT